MLKYLSSSLLFLIFSNSVIAQIQGCAIGNRVYYTSQTIFSPLNTGLAPRESYSSSQYYPYINSSTQTCPNNYTDNAFFQSDVSYFLWNIECNIDATSWDDVVNKGNSGKVVIFKVIRCPLDSYVILLLGLSGLAGLVLLRKQNLSATNRVVTSNLST